MRIIILSAILCVSITSVAQTHIHLQGNDHHEHVHEHAANEIGIGNFFSFLISEQEVAYGLHIHYLRSIHDSKFGYGIGYEQVFDEHNHRTVGLIGSYRPFSHFLVTISPGILFPNSENPQSQFVAHSEVVYEFELGNIHMGPTIEFATTFEEFHIGAGIHLGIAF